MSELTGGALDVAIEALEAELDSARDWQKSTTTNVDNAQTLLGNAEQQAQDADTRVRNAADALDYLQALKLAEDGAEALHGLDEHVDGLPDGIIGAEVDE